MNDKFSINDDVKHKILNLKGRICAFTKQNKAIVVFGSVRKIVKLTELELIKKTASKDKIEFSITKVKVADEIDLHGLNVSQAADILADYLDKCLIARKLRIKIIHGIGGLKLRDCVDNLLKAHPLVKKHEQDSLNPGQTIVWL